jgi:hypothetical protein
MSNLLFVFIAVLFAAANLYSQHVVIFDKNEVCYLNSDSAHCKPADQKKAAFLENFKSHFKGAVPFNSEFNFDTPPLAWGKKVNDFRLARAAYQTSFPGGFIAELWLNNLLPKHEYILTLNGRPDLDGNDLLTEPVPNNEKEKYYDFLTVRTDSKGE